ncbi:necrosis inducing protein-domain-containing protein [Rhexocercosporidium sp. MPI-PUGE-AT-0058]|nr:necrosis inducing protein-domain-containing protein [Rhexocercosporidium sp. MPI-PUGE-AT-0058]
MTVRFSLLALAALSLSIYTTIAAPIAAAEDFVLTAGNDTSSEPLLIPRSILDKLPANANGEQIKWQPALDYDQDGCYNVAAIDGSGNVNGGQSPSNPRLVCRTAERLDKTNVYVRNKCNNGWCGYIYDYYFEADSPGHRHDWEHIVVFLKNRSIKFVATSKHGDYELHWPSELQFEGTHPKIVYHKDGISTHAFRKANAGGDSNNPENHWGSWRYGNLVAWDRFPNEGLRNKLAGWNFGSASMAINDANFNYQLAHAAKDRAPGFNPWA